MKHLFVPYDIALKLKELGFDEPCFYAWCKTVEHRIEYDGNPSLQTDGNPFGTFFMGKNWNTVGKHKKILCSAPLYQQVIDWLRERGVRVYEVYQFNTWSVTEQIKTEEFAHYGWQYTLNEAIEEALRHL